MNLDYLRTLVAIVEHGSLSAAARHLRISQPAVTKQIQRLEADLGLTLLIRGPRQSAELTAAGQTVLEFARETLRRYAALRQWLAELSEVHQGLLALAASTIPGEYVLPALLAAFRVDYPQVEVQMMIVDTAGVVDLLARGEADVGVIGSAVKRSGLALQRLTSDEIVLAVPPGHPFATRARIAVDDLHDQSLLQREPGSGTRHSVESLLADAGLRLPTERVVLTLGSTQAILRGVEEGLGLGFVSARAAAHAQANGHVAIVRVDSLDLQRDLYIAYQRNRAHEPLVRRFVEFARSRFVD